MLAIRTSLFYLFVCCERLVQKAASQELVMCTVKIALMQSVTVWTVYFVLTRPNGGQLDLPQQADSCFGAGSELLPTHWRNRSFRLALTVNDQLPTTQEHKSCIYLAAEGGRAQHGAHLKPQQQLTGASTVCPAGPYPGQDSCSTVQRQHRPQGLAPPHLGESQQPSACCSSCQQSVRLRSACHSWAGSHQLQC